MSDRAGANAAAAGSELITVPTLPAASASLPLLTRQQSRPVNWSRGSGRAGSGYYSPNGVRDVNDFAAEMARLMAERGISGRQLARRVPVDGALICRLRSGKQRPSARVAARIDAELDAGGRLAAMILPPRSRRSVIAAGGGLLAGALLFGPEVAERIARPAVVDARAVDALRGVLAGQRRADDRAGSAAVIGAVTAQLAVVEDLTAGARGPGRLAVVDLAAEWSQFSAWLHISVRDFPAALALCRQALELAVEADDATMITTILRHRAYMAWLGGEPGAAAGLAAAAQRDTRAAASERGNAAMLQAASHAVTGDAAAAERSLGAAMDLAGEMTSRPERERSWSYWYSEPWFGCQRGLVLGYLADSERRRADAIDALAAGFAGLGPDAAGSEWGSDYLVHRAGVHARGGDVGQAVADAMPAVAVARRMRSASLRGFLVQLHAGLAARWPDDPRVVELGDAMRAA